ncbi:hypothetical protein HW555_013334 [Spodoptera exigua]|uniref:DDE Tnp4 domain-containing protein n=1 Tax=Spodoptera exigua TaxID=7107 RepID=A0A835G3P8_SPOEX|nr:hypothetical protein HW555_013334 [Spodoptera exigua]KAH9638843.1 hypothetical protein HF086_012796 [Spodoptera exigua]
MMTPLAEGRVQTREEILYQESQIKTRNVVKRAFGVWKRRFPILSRGISVRLIRVPGIIIATAVLHNLAIQQNENVPPEDPDFPVLLEEVMMHSSQQLQQRGTRNLERTLLIEEYFARL